MDEIKYLKFAPCIQRGKTVSISAWYPNNPAIQGYGNSQPEAKADLLKQIQLAEESRSEEHIPQAVNVSNSGPMINTPENQ